MGKRWESSIEFPQISIREVDGRRMVVKSFQGNPGILKWVALGVIYQGAYPFAVTPESRMKREIEFMSDDHSLIHAPRIVEVDWGKKQVVREYVEGSPLEPWRNPEDSGILGQAIAMAHREGWVLGDTKPTNFILSEGGDIYVVDAEQSIRSEDERLRGWDLLVAAFFLSLMYPADSKAFGERVEGLLTTYVAGKGFRKALGEIFSYRHSTLYALIPLRNLLALRKAVRSLE